MHWLEEGDAPCGGDGRGSGARAGVGRPPDAPIASADPLPGGRPIRPTERRRAPVVGGCAPEWG